MIAMMSPVANAAAAATAPATAAPPAAANAAGSGALMAANGRGSSEYSEDTVEAVAIMWSPHRAIYAAYGKSIRISNSVNISGNGVPSHYVLHQLPTPLQSLSEIPLSYIRIEY